MFLSPFGDIIAAVQLFRVSVSGKTSKIILVKLCLYLFFKLNRNAMHVEPIICMMCVFSQLHS